MAVYQLFNSARGFTMETIFIETLGGSFMYFFGKLVQYLIPLLLYIITLLVADFVLFKSIKGDNNLRKLFNIETIIFSCLFIGFSIMEQSYYLLILPLSFMFSQRIRYKRLNKL